MKLLNNGIIKDSYDVVIVGAGIGGITAGALLAKRGLDVIVIEQHYLPGGVCSTLKRKGIAMDIGAAMLFGWGEGLSPHRYVMNELEEDVYMIPHDCYYRIHFGDKSVTFWKDFDRFFEELNSAFPNKKEQLTGFYNHTLQVYKDMTATFMPMSPDTLPPKLALKMLLTHPIRTRRIQKYMNTSLKDVLDLYVDDPQVENLFDLLIATCYCTKIEETPLMLTAPIVWEAFNGGAVYPAGSPQMFPNALEKALEKYEGQILYRHMVEEIIIKDGAAFGVRLEDGTVINAGKVISDASIWNLYGKLIKPEHISKDRMEWAQSFEPTLSCVLLYMGIKAEVLPEDTNAIEVFVEDLDNFTNDTYFCYIPSIDDPSICPKGTHSMTVLCSTSEVEWPRPEDTEYRSDDYNKRKEKFADRVLDVLETKFPNLKKSIITLDVATPATIERFTLKNYGNIGGPKQALGQHLLNRLKARSEFENLFCVGDSTVMGEGVISATVSAVGAANMILKDLKMKQYLPHKFTKDYINYMEGSSRIPLPSSDETLTGETAKRLAVECQWCEDAKCIQDCPAGIDVHNFIRRLESGNYIGAAKIMREMNPLAEVCGYVCPSERLCESECYRLEYEDGPADIKRLQAWVCKEAGLKGFNKYIPTLNDKRIAIVGSGPAGISCANFLGRLGYEVDIFEKRETFGGMLTNLIPSFRLSRDIVDREYKGILLPTIDIKYNIELGKDIFIEDLVKKYDSVFLAPGLWKGRRLELEKIDNSRISDALSFIREYNVKGQIDVKDNLLIIGGGSVAADAANIALKSGAKKVVMVCLESENEMPALSQEIKELKELGVEIFNSWGPKEFSESKLICKCCTNVYDDAGKFCPEFDDSKIKEFEFDQLIMAIGQTVEPQLESYFKEVFGTSTLDVDSSTQLIKGQTKVYAGGDITRGAGTVVEAVADGRRAAIAIDTNLSNK